MVIRRKKVGGYKLDWFVLPGKSSICTLFPEEEEEEEEEGGISTNLSNI